MIVVLTKLFARFHFSYTNELELQEGVAGILTGAGIEFDREATLSKKDRIDFMVGDTALEIKVDGSLSQVTRQLHRYAQLSQVQKLLLLTTKRQHCRLPESLNGKPLAVIWISPL